MNKAKSALFVAMLLSLLALAGRPAAVEAVPAQQGGNLLNNPSLEGAYVNGAAPGWGRWHANFNVDPKPENCGEAYGVLPKWTPETNGALVHDGALSQHIGNQFDTWHAGLAQDVAVTPGSRYRFSFWAIGRASQEQYPAPSDASVNLGVRAGIDPNGSGLWSDTDIVWGAAGSPHDSGNQANWQQFSVEAVAAGPTITVFLGANLTGPGQCRSHLDVWFDQAELVSAGPPPTATSPPQPTAPPQPTLPPVPAATNTPVPPTETPTPEVTPTDTSEPPTPTDVPTETPTPSTGATICLNAFADENANGVQDEGEGFMAGVVLVIAQDEEIISQVPSTGVATPVCVEGLEPGTYQVAMSPPASLEMTTAANTAVAIGEGDEVQVAFGSRLRPATQEEGEEPDAVSEVDPPEVDDDVTVGEPAAEGGELNLLAISGLIAIVVAIALLGVLIFLLVRRTP